MNNIKPTKIELGDAVKCTVTGLTGVATARCLYLHGCDHIGIQPRADNKTGRVPSLVWVDSPQVEVVGRKVVAILSAVSSVGGPNQHPGDRQHPSPESDEGMHLKG